MYTIAFKDIGKLKNSVFLTNSYNIIKVPKHLRNQNVYQIIASIAMSGIMEVSLEQIVKFLMDHKKRIFSVNSSCKVDCTFINDLTTQQKLKFIYSFEDQEHFIEYCLAYKHWINYYKYYKFPFYGLLQETTSCLLSSAPMFHMQRDGFEGELPCVSEKQFRLYKEHFKVWKNISGKRE